MGPRTPEIFVNSKVLGKTSDRPDVQVKAVGELALAVPRGEITVDIPGDYCRLR
jgi:hypothetical protein